MTAVGAIDRYIDCKKEERSILSFFIVTDDLGTYYFLFSFSTGDDTTLSCSIATH